MTNFNFSLAFVHFRIFYQALRDIHPGEELLVFYGPVYTDRLGLWEEYQISAVCYHCVQRIHFSAAECRSLEAIVVFVCVYGGTAVLGGQRRHDSIRIRARVD